MPVLANLAKRLGGTPWFARVGRVVVPLDRLVGRLTKGRIVAMGLRDLPSLLLTTTGRKTGKARTNPVLFVRDGESFVVIGSNWGQRHHPAWSHNLLANPAAVINVRGEEIPVRARLTHGDERDRLWRLLLATWPPFAAYKERAHRSLRIFQLERQRP